MKKVLFTAVSALLMLTCADAFAQFSIGAGFTNSALKEKAGDVKETTKANGLYVGVDYTLNLTEHLGIVPGVEWVYVMDKEVKNLDAIVTNITGEAKFKEHYVNIPVDVTYGINLKDLRIYAFAGPTFSFNLSSKTKGTLTAFGKEKPATYDTKDIFGTYNAFDLMLGAGVGVDLLEKLRVKFGYDWGLLNRGDDSIKLHRQQLKLGVAWIF